MGASREKLQADFDLERFIEMFDEALTSDDERVVNALRSLMMMVILTKSESGSGQKIGPLRQLFDDMHNINRRLNDTEERVRSIDGQLRNRGYAKDYFDQEYRKYSMNDVQSWQQTMSEEKYKYLQSTLAKINKP